MSDHQKFAKQEPVFTALMAIALKIENMDQRIDRRLNSLEEGMAKVVSSQDKQLAMMEKLLEGQAVLHQNDMEIKRRLDAKHD